MNNMLSLLIRISAIFIFSFAVFYSLKPAWILFLLFFYIGIFFILKKGKINILKTWRKRFFLFWIFFYPLLGSIIVYMIEKDVIAYSWRFLNTIEHILLTGSITAIVLLFLHSSLQNIQYIPKIICLFSIVITIGVGIEILQYFYRIFLFTDPPLFRLAAYYEDTILDTITNIFSTFFWCIIWIPCRK